LRLLAPHVSDAHYVSRLAVRQYEGDPWPFAGESAEAREDSDGSVRPFGDCRETDPEIWSFVHDDAASFARILLREVKHARSASLEGFRTFEDFLVPFRAFAAHHQRGQTRPKRPGNESGVGGEHMDRLIDPNDSTSAIFSNFRRNRTRVTVAI
jgi:hypothetical protein